MMDHFFHEENQQLRKKLDDLLKQARANEKKQELYESFGFEIIGASTPGQLRDLLLSRIITHFKLLDVVLCLVDHTQDTEYLFLGRSEPTADTEHNLMILDVRISSVVYSIWENTVDEHT